jgi:homoaconitase
VAHGIDRSFAHVRRYIIQKQGILPLWFVDEADYSRISAMDDVETVGLANILNGDLDAQVTLRVTKSTGETIEIPTKHTLSADQVSWIKHGSALNYIATVKNAA